MEELIPTLQEEGEERIDTLAEQTIIAGVQTINGKAGDLDLKTINNTDLLTPGNINLATPTDIHNLDTAKQDKLVAGTNIQIAADGKTISATDTTYSAGSGLNLTGTTFSVDTDTIATQNDIYTLQTTKQDNLTTPQLNAVNSGIDSTKVAQIATNEGDIATINGKIPTQASTSNQLADKNFVNSSVQTATANYRGSWDDWASVPTQASDYPEDYAGSHTPTVNDYMVVQDASDYTEETLEGTWRFKYTGEWNTNGKSGWLPEYQVNETPLTAAQIAAINSGITDTLVAQISTNQSNISDLTTNKLDKNTTFWGQSVQNGAVQGTLTLTESGQNATIATSGHNTTDAGIKMGNSKNYVEAGVTEITLSSTTGGIKLKPKSGSSVDVMSSKITNLATPTANTDASTKKYVDDGLAAKQNTLTAGANITITGDEISATDTTYTAGAGLTLTGTEFSVNDPAPSGFFTDDGVTENTGTSLTLNNQLAVEPKSVQLDGDTKQNTLSGKNLLNPSPYSTGGFYNQNVGTQLTNTFDAGITVSTTGNKTSIVGTVSYKGAVFVSTPLTVGQTYRFSGGASIDIENQHRATRYMLDSTFTVTRKLGNTTSGSSATYDSTVTPEAGEVYFAVYEGVNSRGDNPTFTLECTDFQLEAGATKTDWEQYVGGVPSPNPNYPQDINVVTGDQTVLTTGKNWLSNTENDWSFSTANNMINQTAGRYAQWGKIDGGKTYTMSRKAVGSSTYWIVAFTTSVPDVNTIAIGWARPTDYNVTEYSFETPAEAKYAVVFYGSGLSEEGQLELGSTATAYEPYRSQSYTIELGATELCKIGTYQDYIYKSNGNWYKHAAISKKVYDGTEPWSVVTWSETEWGFYKNVPGAYQVSVASEVGPIISNYFSANSLGNMSAAGRVYYGVGLSRLNPQIVIKNKDCADTTAFQTWLSSHNTTVYYALATPTDTQITNTGLITQLEALAGAKIYRPQTNILTSGVSPNVDVILTIDTFQNNWNGLIEKLEN